jgi:hypothetical protein
MAKDIGLRSEDEMPQPEGPFQPSPVQPFLIDAKLVAKEEGPP